MQRYTRVNLSHVRRHLTELIRRVTVEDHNVVIYRHGKRVAVIVSMQNFHRIIEDQDEEKYGPINPETGRRPGPAWVRKTGWVKPPREKIRPAPAKRTWWSRLTRPNA